uniref:Glutathione peroxidase n=1 Tax=Dugesia japonica TaxID=6161 RepID=M9NV22_DUGJA|nr:glutathione peroxidase [Dugesia japonica]
MALKYFLLFYQIILSIKFIDCEKSVFDFSVKDADGNSLHLSDFSGKVLLFTNVASECGYTDSHYKMYVKLQEKYGPKGFQILAFPCNDFGKQEPQTSDKVFKWAKSVYNVNFPILHKISLLSKDKTTPDVWNYLLDQSEYPGWNFWKYITGSDGRLVEYLDNFQMDDVIEPIIIKALNTKEDL